MLLSGTTDMSAHDQLLLELVNRARANPVAEASRHGVNLNQGIPSSNRISSSPKQPLAPNDSLATAAVLHSEDMLARNYFSHTAPAPAPNGSSPSARAQSAGYDHGAGENLSWTGTTGTLNRNASIEDRHRSLFRSPGHRQNLMVEYYLEGGMGVDFGRYTTGGTTYNAVMVTQLFGTNAYAADNFITGVVFQDAVSGSNNDSFYSIGEGRGGTIRAYAADGTEYRTAAGAAGGFGVQVPDGTYTVELTRGADSWIVEGVVVDGANQKVDFELTTATEGSYEPPAERPNAGEEPADFIARNDNGTWLAFKGQSTTDGSISLAADNFGFWDGSVDWQHVSFGDFNGDNRTDAAGFDPQTGEWHVGLSDGDQFHTSQFARWNPAANWHSVQVGDFNADGLDDLAARTQGGNWYVSTSDGQSFTNRRWAYWNPSRTWDDVSVGDFNGDGRDDLLARNDSNTWYVSRANGAATRFITSSFGRWNPGITWSHITVADFTNDGRDDIAAVIENTGSVYVGRSTGSRFSTQRWGVWQAEAKVDVLPGDFNGDGRLDLAGRSVATGVWTVSLNEGNRFVDDLDAGSWDAAADWAAVFAADLNGDGVDDLAGLNADDGRLYASDTFYRVIRADRVATLSPNYQWTDLAVEDFDL